MNWWLDLSDDPLHAVQFVEGESRHVAVWFSPLSADFYLDDSGAYFGTLDIDPPDNFDPSGDIWRRFVDSLRISADAYVDPVEANGVAVRLSHDGRLRVYWDRPHRLVLESDGQFVDLPFDDDAPLVAVGLDRDLGTIAALSASKALHFYQQNVYVGRYGLSDVSLGHAARVFLPDAAGVAVVVHDKGALVVDLGGRVRARTVLSSVVDVAACAPGGQFLALGERHSGLMHVYDIDLTLLHQGHSHNVLERAQALQLMPRFPAENEYLSSLAVADDGALAFTLGGAVCRSHIEVLPDLPHPRTLF